MLRYVLAALRTLLPALLPHVSLAEQNTTRGSLFLACKMAKKVNGDGRTGCPRC
jgi:hypothetical protein